MHSFNGEHSSAIFVLFVTHLLCKDLESHYKAPDGLPPKSKQALPEVIDFRLILRVHDLVKMYYRDQGGRLCVYHIALLLAA